MGALRERMVREMQLRRLAPGTQKAYVRAVAELTRHYGRSPDRIGPEQVKSYLLYLMNQRRLNWSTVNVVSAAVRFFYGQTLGRPDVGFTLLLGQGRCRPYQAGHHQQSCPSHDGPPSSRYSFSKLRA